MPLVEQYVTIACVSNKVGGDLVGNALWRGVRLRDVLDRAGVQAGATQVVGRSFDGWTAGFPTAWLDDPEREALVAVAMNGDPLPPEHGYPARLIVPGLYGYVSATKWLTNIELTTLEAFNGYWVPLGWAKEAPILTQSRIDVPSSAPRSAPAAAGRRRGLGAGPRHRARWRCRSTTGRGRRPSCRPRSRMRPGCSGSTAGTRPPATTPCASRHRRHRRGADRHGHRARSGRSARLPHHQRQGGLTASRRIGSVPAPRAPLFIVNPAAPMGRAQRAGAADRGRARPHRRQCSPCGDPRGGARRAARGSRRPTWVMTGSSRSAGDGTAQEVLNGLMAAGAGPDGRTAGLRPRSWRHGQRPGAQPGPAIDADGGADRCPRRAHAADGPGQGLARRRDPLLLGRRGHGLRCRGGLHHGRQAGALAARPGGLCPVDPQRAAALQEPHASLRLATDAGDPPGGGPFLFVAFANGPFYGGGMRICPDASISDGLLDLCLAGDIGRLGALRELPGIYRGAHVNHPLVEMTRVRALRIEGEGGTRGIHLDGEPFGMLPVDVSVRQAAVAVAAPIG